MEELIGTNPRPHLSENYIPPVEVTPANYDILVNNDLRFRGKRYDRINTGFHGLIGLAELASIVRDSVSKDKRKRRRARMRALLAH